MQSHIEYFTELRDLTYASRSSTCRDATINQSNCHIQSRQPRQGHKAQAAEDESWHAQWRHTIVQDLRPHPTNGCVQNELEANKGAFPHHWLQFLSQQYSCSIFLLHGTAHTGAAAAAAPLFLALLPRMILLMTKTAHGTAMIRPCTPTKCSAMYRTPITTTGCSFSFDA